MSQVVRAALLATVLSSCEKASDRAQARSQRSASESPSAGTSARSASAAVSRGPALEASQTSGSEQVPVRSVSDPPPEPGTADLDPSNDEVVAPPEAVADCEARLRALGVSFAPAELRLSEHSYGNAIDVRSFRLSDGRKISVLQHFGRPTQEPSSKEGRFLRALARRAFDEDVFSVVLTEFFDALHRDHFHLDMARYRLDGTR